MFAQTYPIRVGGKVLQKVIFLLWICMYELFAVQGK